VLSPQPTEAEGIHSCCVKPLNLWLTWSHSREKDNPCTRPTLAQPTSSGGFLGEGHGGESSRMSIGKTLLAAGSPPLAWLGR
jgi:hypothetical protein